MASSSNAPTFRSFMHKEIIQELTPKHIEALAYTAKMPLPDYSESGVKFLMKMEMQDKFSASNVLPLAEMLKDIGRNDLSKKVEKFHKTQKKKKKDQKKEQKKKDHLPADDMLQMCHITASLKTIKLQTKILLEQIEELQTTACEMGYTEVEAVIKDAIAIIEEEFQEKLQLASRKLPQLRQQSVDSLDSNCPLSLSSNEDVVSPPGTLERGLRQRSGAGTGQTLSLPRDFKERKQPLIPPSVPQTIPVAIHVQDTEEPLYEYVTHTSFSPPQDMPTAMHYSSSDIVPSSIQRESREQISERTPNQGKPPIARKPTKLRGTPATRNSTSSLSSMYASGTGSLDTSTGDSGFVDTRQFIKEFPPHIHPRHKYTPLKPEHREVISCYATPEAATKDEIYDDVTYGDKNSYINHPTR